MHVHDPIGWWPGHPQPFTLHDILAIAQYHPETAARLTGPRHSDPRTALGAFGIPVRATHLWRWPFSSDVEYLACATIT